MEPSPPESNVWRKCSACKKPIPFGGPYQVCSVSTCQGKRTGLVFCSVECWDSHLGFANHRSAAAEERRAPSRAEARQETQGSDRAPQRRIITRHESVPRPASSAPETLVVVSKVKQWVRDRSGMNTSQCAIDAMTKRVADACLDAIEEARQSGRKTVMGRDFKD